MLDNLGTPGKQRQKLAVQGHAETGNKTAADSVHIADANYFMNIILLKVPKAL